MFSFSIYVCVYFWLSGNKIKCIIQNNLHAIPKKYHKKAKQNAKPPTFLHFYHLYTEMLFLSTHFMAH